MVLKKRPWRWPETAWGFPLPEDGVPDKKVKRQRGVALLISIMIIATMVIFTTDMVINSTVNLQLAVVNRDNIKAEYMAKSGLNLAIFLISADLGIDLLQFTTQKTSPSDGPSDIWGLVNGLPIGGETLEMVSEMTEAFALSKVNDSQVLDQLQLFDGQFSILVQDENQKINVNACIPGRATECLTMLEALMSCPAEREFLERKKLKPREVAANIKDWGDFDNKPVEEWSPHSSESDPYDGRNPKVSVKNAPFDSLDELKMVEGWDDDMHRVFSPYLTIFPVPPEGARQFRPRVNINTASRAMLSCLMPEGAVNCGDKIAKFMNPVEDIEAPPNASSLSDINNRLKEVFCENDAKRQKWFTYRSDVFRVQAAGVVGNQEKTIEVVLQRGMPDAVDKKNEFVSSYKYLYWKML